MTPPKNAVIGIILLAAFLIIGIVLGMNYLQTNNASRETAVAISPTSAIPSIQKISPTQSSDNAGIANPASVFCGEQGGKSEIITASDGSQAGQCVFPDGKKCDEWKFFRTKVCN